MTDNDRSPWYWITHPVAAVSAIGSFVVGYVTSMFEPVLAVLDQVFVFVIDTSGTWFSAIAVTVSTVLPRIGVVARSTATGILVAAGVMYVGTLLYKLYDNGKERF